MNLLEWLVLAIVFILGLYAGAGIIEGVYRAVVRINAYREWQAVLKRIEKSKKEGR